MTLNHNQRFQQIMESMLNESSTAIDILRDVPGGPDLAMHVLRQSSHNNQLPHDAQFKRVKQPKLSQHRERSSNYGGWILIRAERGAAIIGASRSEQVTAWVIDPETGEIQTHSSNQVKDHYPFIRRVVGRPLEFYQAISSYDFYRKRFDREESKRKPDAQQMTIPRIVKKLRPIWKKGLIAAEAELRGTVLDMIKKGAYPQAGKRLNTLKEIREILDQMETGDDISAEDPLLMKAATYAVLMSAAHFYPRETGEITRSRWGEPSSEWVQGPHQLLKDISNGDINKMKTVLGFFKRSLTRK